MPLLNIFAAQAAGLRATPLNSAPTTYRFLSPGVLDVKLEKSLMNEMAMSGVAVRVSAKLKGLGGFPVKGGYLLGPPDLDIVDRPGRTARSPDKHLRPCRSQCDLLASQCGGSKGLASLIRSI